MLQPRTDLFVEGRWTSGDTGFSVHDKFSGAVIADVAAADDVCISRAVEALQKGFDEGVSPPIERARILRRTAQIIENLRPDFVETIVGETGFTYSDANGEVDRALTTLGLCAEEATRIVGETVPFASTAGQHMRVGYTIRVPLGIVCAITPFNSPLNTVVHKIGPAIAAGNAVILKPSALTPLTSSLLVSCLLEAGMPPSLIALIQGPGGSVGDALLSDKRIAFYSFTGSTRVGLLVQQKARLRRTQLELGSIASALVCKDADLEVALPKIANASFRKAGQVCTSVQRLYVQQDVLKEVTTQFAEYTRTMTHGDPRDQVTRVGPMISEVEAQRAESWIKEAEGRGARIVCGGRRDRSVLAPTIMTDVTDGMNIVDKEVFAPLVSILPFSDVEDAFKHANNTAYGLAAGIFTKDVNVALLAARSLRFGAVHINETPSSRADAMPFGGVKDSGYGQEGPKYAIREVTEERLITLNT